MGFIVSVERYSRQMLFKYIGTSGQEKIMNAHVLIVCIVDLGTHLALGLIRADVGELTIVDRDYIEYSNLQRQTMFTEMDAADKLPKVVAAERNLMAIRQNLRLHLHIAHVDRL